MVTELSSKVKSLKTRSIKTCKQHVIYNQNVYCKILFEVFYNLLASFFIITVIKYKSRLQSIFVMLNLFQHLFIMRFRNKFGMTRFQLGMTIQFILNLIKILIELSCLFTCFTNNHSTKCRVSL